MIALTPLASWLLLITIGVSGAAIAVVVARAFDAADDRRSIEQWRAMCDEIGARDFHDLDGVPGLRKAEFTIDFTNWEGPYDWEEHDDQTPSA